MSTTVRHKVYVDEAGHSFSGPPAAVVVQPYTKLVTDPAAPRLTVSRCRSSFICDHLAAFPPIADPSPFRYP